MPLYDDSIHDMGANDSAAMYASLSVGQLVKDVQGMIDVSSSSTPYYLPSHSF